MNAPCSPPFRRTGHAGSHEAHAGQQRGDKDHRPTVAAATRNFMRSFYIEGLEPGLIAQGCQGSPGLVTGLALR